jgi:hypothetical protein
MGMELRGFYLPHEQVVVLVGILSEAWPVWSLVLQALEINNDVCWGKQQCIIGTLIFQGSLSACILYL